MNWRLKRRYGRSRAPRGQYRFLIEVTRPNGQTQGAGRHTFGDANRDAIESVRSGRSKRAKVFLNEHVPGHGSRLTKLAQYEVGPGGGVMSVYSPGGR